MTGTIVDMHLHTTSGASDSALTPEQLVEFGTICATILTKLDPQSAAPGINGS